MKEDQIKTLVDILITQARRAENELCCGTDFSKGGAYDRAEAALETAKQELLQAFQKIHVHIKQK